jgi:hypothetical protein
VQQELIRWPIILLVDSSNPISPNPIHEPTLVPTAVLI